MNEEEELLDLFTKRDTNRLFEKAVSYLAERNALFKERELLHNSLYEIKDYLKRIREENQKGILSSYSLIEDNIIRLCNGEKILGSDKE